jgi:hypothetical protein
MREIYVQIRELGLIVDVKLKEIRQILVTYLFRQLFIQWESIACSTPLGIVSKHYFDNLVLAFFGCTVVKQDVQQWNLVIDGREVLGQIVGPILFETQRNFLCRVMVTLKLNGRMKLEAGNKPMSKNKMGMARGWKILLILKVPDSKSPLAFLN